MTRILPKLFDPLVKPVRASIRRPTRETAAGKAKPPKLTGKNVLEIDIDDENIEQWLVPLVRTGAVVLVEKGDGPPLVIYIYYTNAQAKSILQWLGSSYLDLPKITQKDVDADTADVFSTPGGIDVLLKLNKLKPPSA